MAITKTYSQQSVNLAYTMTELYEIGKVLKN